MLREEIEQYTKLTGEDGRHVTIARLGAYLDGYNKGLGVLDKLRAEIEELDGAYVIGDYGIYGENAPKYVRLLDVLQIIAKYKEAESEE